MTGADPASESPGEPTGVNRLEPWMRRHPQYVAGIWAFLALIGAVGVLLADGDELLFALRLALTLGWTLLAVREVRRYRHGGKGATLEPSYELVERGDLTGEAANSD